MAIYHCSIKIISRSNGSSVISSSAYRSGTKLMNNETNTLCDYSRKTGVIFNEVLLCENAPKEYANREILWNEVQKIEKSSNSQLAREIEVALPKELTQEQQIEVVRNFIKEQFTSKGMCADWALHKKNSINPHAHILLTTRPIEPSGKWGLKEKKGYALDEHGQRIPLIDKSTGLQKVDKRNRKQWKREYIQSNDWNNKDNAEIWRKAWAINCNKYLDKDNQIDNRSYQKQGISQKPTIHEGYVARKMERQGKVSERCQINRDIFELNEVSSKIKQLNWLEELALKNDETTLDIEKMFDFILDNNLIDLNMVNELSKTHKNRLSVVDIELNRLEKEKSECSETLAIVKMLPCMIDIFTKEKNTLIEKISICDEISLISQKELLKPQEKIEKTSNIKSKERIPKNIVATLDKIIQTSKTIRLKQKELHNCKIYQFIKKSELKEHLNTEILSLKKYLTVLSNNDININHIDVNNPTKESINLLKKSVNDKYYPKIEKSQDTPIEQVVEKEKKSRFCLDDLHSDKYASKSTKDSQLQKKDISHDMEL